MKSFLKMKLSRWELKHYHMLSWEKCYSFQNREYQTIYEEAETPIVYGYEEESTTDTTTGTTGQQILQHGVLTRKQVITLAQQA